MESVAVCEEKLFKLEFEEAKQVKAVLEAVQALVDDVTISVDYQGLHIRQMDASHVSMVCVDVEKYAMQDFSCSYTEPVKFQVDLKKLLEKGFKRVKSDESLVVEGSIGKLEGKLALGFKGSFGKDYEFKVSSPIEADDVPEPKIDFRTQVKLLSKALREAVEDVITVTESYGLVRLTADNEQFTVSGESEENGRCKVQMRKFDERILGLDVKEPSIANYSPDFLKTIVTATEKLSEVATVNFSSKMPVKITLDLRSPIRFVYYLAPKLTDEDTK